MDKQHGCALLSHIPASLSYTAQLHIQHTGTRPASPSLATAPAPPRPASRPSSRRASTTRMMPAPRPRSRMPPSSSQAPATRSPSVRSTARRDYSAGALADTTHALSIRPTRADRALARGQEFAAAANCTSLACLEALPLPDLLWASKRVSAPVRTDRQASVSSWIDWLATCYPPTYAATLVLNNDGSASASGSPWWTAPSSRGPPRSCWRRQKGWRSSRGAARRTPTTGQRSTTSRAPPCGTRTEATRTTWPTSGVRCACWRAWRR